MDMRSSKIWAMALVLFSVLLLANVAMAGQASSYTETNLSGGRCEQYAFDAARSGGFNDIVVNNPTVSFNSGPYQCGARCILKHDIVFIYCVGPESGQAHEIVEYMKNYGQWIQ